MSDLQNLKQKHEIIVKAYLSEKQKTSQYEKEIQALQSKISLYEKEIEEKDREIQGLKIKTNCLLTNNDMLIHKYENEGGKQSQSQSQSQNEKDIEKNVNNDNINQRNISNISSIPAEAVSFDGGDYLKKKINSFFNIFDSSVGGNSLNNTNTSNIILNPQQDQSQINDKTEKTDNPDTNTQYLISLYEQKISELNSRLHLSETTILDSNRSYQDVISSQLTKIDQLEKQISTSTVELNKINLALITIINQNKQYEIRFTQFENMLLTKSNEIKSLKEIIHKYNAVNENNEKEIVKYQKDLALFKVKYDRILDELQLLNLEFK